MKTLMKPLVCLLTALPATAGVASGDEPKKPAYQYKSKGIEVTAATADEPKVKAFGPQTVKAAAKYLDDGAHYWVRERTCLACHSTGVYMVERSALTKQLGKPSEEVLKDFIGSVPKKDGKPGVGDAATSVWRSSGLASWDRHVTGKLSDHTAQSLRHTLTILPDDNMYDTIKLIEIPYITTRFELTVQAMRAMVTAPGWLAKLEDAEQVARVKRIKTFLRDHKPLNDYELALKLQLANLDSDLVTKKEREAAIEMLWKKQLPDGGWSTRRMSELLKWRVEVHPATERQPWKEAMDPFVVKLIKSLPDADDPGSDPYMTAFAIVLLRESGVPSSDKRIKAGVAWLKENQRESGRWWMHSLYRGNYNYITYIATAQALRALALCDELPEPDGR
jgi:squalene-hopene/tetraprenyl-beta-curcumene cyclase